MTEGRQQLPADRPHRVLVNPLLQGPASKLGLNTSEGMCESSLL